MQLTYYFVALISAVGVYAQVADPGINTPGGVQQCLPVQITFSGTSPPFIITVVPGGQANAAPLETIGTTSATALTWTPQQAVGTQLTLLIRDSLGRTNPSAAFTILAGNTNCVGGAGATGSSAAVDSSAPVSVPVSTIAVSSSTAGPSSVIPVTTAVVATTTAPVTTTNAAGSSITSSRVATLLSAAPTTTTAAGSGASALKPAAALAGLVGLVGAALL
jgi:hypothetical protein